MFFAGYFTSDRPTPTDERKDLTSNAASVGIFAILLDPLAFLVFARSIVRLSRVVDPSTGPSIYDISSQSAGADAPVNRIWRPICTTPAFPCPDACQRKLSDAWDWGQRFAL